VIIFELDFLANPYEQDHEREEADANQDVDDVCHGSWFFGFFG